MPDLAYPYSITRYIQDLDLGAVMAARRGDLKRFVVLAYRADELRIAEIKLGGRDAGQ